MIKFTKMLAAVAVSISGMAGATYAQDVTLKIGWTTADSESDPYAITAHKFAEALEEVSPGTFEVQFFPNNQLGDEKQMVEGLSFGTLDMGVITNAVVANLEPAFLLNDMPFLYSSSKQAHELLDGEIGMELMTKLETRGIVGLGFAESGFRNMLNNVRPVTTPEDIVGVKYRVMQNPVFVSMFQSLGGEAVPMAWGEVYTAVQQGTIDGLEIPIPVVKGNNFSDIVEYLSLTRHTYTTLELLISKRVFYKLDDDQQDAVRKAATLAIERQREVVRQNTENMIASLKQEGMEVNETEDPAAFRNLVGDVYEKFKPEIGAELFDRALNNLQ